MNRAARGLLRNLRKQAWFERVARQIEEAGATFEVAPPSGHGHPKLLITHEGRTTAFGVPCSGQANSRNRLLQMRVRRFLSGEERL